MLLCGRAGRLAAQNGGFRPEQEPAQSVHTLRLVLKGEAAPGGAPCDDGTPDAPCWPTGAPPGLGRIVVL